MQDKDRLFECKNCGQAVAGWNAATFWFDCGCGNYDPQELTPDEYREVYGQRYASMTTE